MKTKKTKSMRAQSGYRPSDAAAMVEQAREMKVKHPFQTQLLNPKHSWCVICGRGENEHAK